jgi:hypothetical protein
VNSDGTTYERYGEKQYINCKLEDVPRTFVFRGRYGGFKYVILLIADFICRCAIQSSQHGAN